MPSVNVTIRHARIAMHLLLSGALRDIELETARPDGEPDDDRQEATSNLFYAVVDEALQWEIPGTLDAHTRKCVHFVAALKSDPNAPTQVKEWLANHGLAD